MGSNGTHLICKVRLLYKNTPVKMFLFIKNLPKINAKNIVFQKTIFVPTVGISILEKFDYVQRGKLTYLFNAFLETEPA